MLFYLCAICYFFEIVTSAWVEIPQITNEKTPFVLGAPKLERVSKTTVTTYKKIMTTPFPPNVLTPSSPTINITNSREELENTNSSINTNHFSFLELLNTIQHTLKVDAKKSLKKKISLLTNLRDNLLANIDERMANLWKPVENSVEARGHHGDEMDFPSNEGALMTIGFLTFAVFLIKLVLKLIHALKYKNNIINGTMGMTGMTGMPTGTATYFGRKKRSFNDDIDSLQILQFIDEYKFN